MIVVDISRCTGCRRCETACAFYHTGKTHRNLSRIKVMNIYDKGVDSPVVCLQCEERFCAQCPADAIRMGDHGEVLVSPTLCVECGACERNCPVGAVELFEDIPFVCDLCGGKPRCIEACTQGALSYEPGKQVSLKDRKKETDGMKPSEKRYHHVSMEGGKLRQRWRVEND